MWNGDVILKAGWSQYRVMTGATTTGTTGYFSRQVQSSQAMNHGNFHDPTSWWYNTRTTWYNRGTQRTLYLGGPYSGQSDYFQGYVAGSNEPLIPSGTASRNHAYNSALSRLNEKVRGGLDLGVTLAEFGQTRKMIANLAEVAKFAKVSGFGSGRDLANGWLAWQYGWRQLQQDVWNVLDESTNIALKTIQKIRASATCPEGYNGVGNNILSGTVYVPSRNVSKGKAVCRFTIKLEVSGFDFARFTSLNPVSLAWELIPYSFVVDWFWNVGSYLRDLETALIYQSAFRGGYVSELYVMDGEEYRSTDTVLGGTNPPYKMTFTGFNRRYKHRFFQRTVLSTYPLPRRPVLRADLGSQRLLSTASLLAQMIK